MGNKPPTVHIHFTKTITSQIDSPAQAKPANNDRECSQYRNIGQGVLNGLLFMVNGA